MVFNKGERGKFTPQGYLVAGFRRITDNDIRHAVVNALDQLMIEVAGGSMDISGSVTIPPATAFKVRGMDVAMVASAVDTAILPSVSFVQIKADLANTLPIYFGEVSTVNISGANRGFQLNPGEAETLPVASGVSIYVIAGDGAQKLMYTLFNGGL